MERIDQIYNAAARVLEVADQNQELAGKSIEAMNHAISRLELRFEGLKIQIKKEIETSLKSSINNTAHILTEEFQAANKKADEAARRYEKAARYVAWNSAAMGIAIVVAFLVGATVAIFFRF
jgi:hypothetical protein